MEALHQPGEIIDQRYRILDTLGKGGIGTTYTAENLETGERVALKVVSLRGTNDPKVLELFEREARILSQLNHPGIPRYLDYFQVNKRRNIYFYLAQQLVKGQSLFEVVENGWQPQEVEVWHIANQILDILVYLQQFTPPVIHRDIKPQNILRRSDGKVFLVDFGAVQDVYHGTLTGGSTVAGTYGYMAPEQFRGKTILATDLYGLGATLIFLLNQKDPADLPKRKLKIDFRPHVRVTKRFANWLERMIEPVAEDRFRSAGEALMVWQGKKELSSSVTSKNHEPIESQLTSKNDEKRLELAKQGNVKAITSLLNKHFKTKKITIKASIKKGCLILFLASDEVPAKQASVALIREEVVNLGVESLHLVKVYGWRKGEDHPTWKFQFKIVSPAKSALPSGCILRKTNSQDRFQLTKLIYFDFNFKQILVIGLFFILLGLSISLFVFFIICIFFSYEMPSDLYSVIYAILIIFALISIVFFIFLILYSVTFSFNKKKSNSWVIECNKRLVAFIELSKLNGHSYIRELFVAPNWRRKGLGSALIKHLIQEVTKPVYVRCSSELMSYYIRLGFVQSDLEDSDFLNLLIYNNSVSTIDSSLLEDCTLRKANLQDKSKLSKFEPVELNWNILCANLLGILSLLYFPIFYFLDVYIIKITIIAGFLILITQIPSIYLQVQLFFNFRQYISGLWVIEYQRNIVASVKLKQSPKNIYLNNLYVAKTWRRKGLGSSLIKRIIQESTQPIYLKCYPQLVSFYTRLDFIQSGTPSRWNGITTMVYTKK